MRAKDLMTHEVITGMPEPAVETIAQLLTAHWIGGVPVLCKGVLAGIITRADLIRLLARR